MEFIRHLFTAQSVKQIIKYVCNHVASLNVFVKQRNSFGIFFYKICLQPSCASLNVFTRHNLKYLVGLVSKLPFAHTTSRVLCNTLAIRTK